MANLLTRLKGIIKSSQNTNLNYNKAIYNWLGSSVIWNNENDEAYIKQGYQTNATVYSIIQLISKTASNVPFQIYEVKNQNDLKRYKALTSGVFDAGAINSANLVKKRAMVELSDTSLHELLERPNPLQSYSSWLTEIISFGKLTGNRYIYGIAPDTGPNANKFRELYVLPSQYMEIISGGIMQPVEKYKLQYNGNFDINANEICHIKDFNPNYDGTGAHLYGQSPLRAGLRSLTTNNDAVETGLKYLQNQTARGVLMSDEGDINEVQAQQLKDKFRAQAQGVNNAGDIVITPKKLSWVNFGLPATDLALIEQYNASVKDLCNIYNVPVELLNNTDSSTFNNKKEAKKQLYQYAVIPELINLRDELNRWLAPQYGPNIYIDFDFSAIPELQDELSQIVTQLASAWWVTPNEKREAMYYGKDDQNNDLDKYYMPANLVPMDQEIVEVPKSIDLNLPKYK